MKVHRSIDVQDADTTIVADTNFGEHVTVLETELRGTRVAIYSNRRGDSACTSAWLSVAQLGDLRDALNAVLRKYED